MKYDTVKTDNYLLVVDDSEIKVGDLVYRSLTRKDVFILDDFGLHLHNIGSSGDGYKKIIAHLPLNNSPILEGIDLLPPLEQEDDVELYYQKQVMQPYPVESQSYTAYEKGFIDGYNKAKEKFNSSVDYA